MKKITLWIEKRAPLGNPLKDIIFQSQDQEAGLFLPLASKRFDDRQDHRNGSDNARDFVHQSETALTGRTKTLGQLFGISQAYRYRRPRGGARYQLLFPLVRVNFELGVIMVIAVSCVKLLSAHNSTQHTSRKHKV